MMSDLCEDIDSDPPREAFECNALVGFNFGEGRRHDQALTKAIQKRRRVAPGVFTGDGSTPSRCDRVAGR